MLDLATMASIGKAGAAAAIGLGAVGSALGTGIAGAASVGAWKKCYAQSKQAPFQLLIFIGAPLSQTIYGMILMNAMVAQCNSATETVGFPAMLGAGIFGGMAMGVSAWFQGKAGAAGADALAETGKGFGNYLMTIGVVETVALFILVFIQATFKVA